MLSQLAPSGNMVFSPSRTHQSPKPSTSNLPTLAQSSSSHGSANNSTIGTSGGIAAVPLGQQQFYQQQSQQQQYQQQQQQAQGIPNFSSPFSLNSLNSATIQQQYSQMNPILSTSGDGGSIGIGPHISPSQSPPQFTFTSSSSSALQTQTPPQLNFNAISPSQTPQFNFNSSSITPTNQPSNHSVGNTTPLSLLPPLPLPQFHETSSSQGPSINNTSSYGRNSMTTQGLMLNTSGLTTHGSNLSQQGQFNQFSLQHQVAQENNNNETNPLTVQSPQQTNPTTTTPSTEEFPDDQIVERALLEDSFIEHGLLAVDKNVSILGEILNLSEGRDKLFKLFSAVLKLLRYGITNWLPQSDLTADILGRIKACSSATSTTRLFLKLCTDWVFFRLSARVYSQQRPGMLKFFTLSRLLGMAGYFTFQWPVWFQATGLAKTIDKGFWQKLSLRCYIVSVCSQIFMDMRKAIDLTKEIGYWQLIVPGDALKELEKVNACQDEVCHTVDTPVTTAPPSHSASQSSPSATPLNNTPQSPLNPARSPKSSPNGDVDEIKSSPTINPKTSNPSCGASPVVTTSRSPVLNHGAVTKGPGMVSGSSFSKLPSLAQNPDINPTYALSFQSRCTPTTARYQALLNRTIWQQQLQAQIAAAQQLSATPQSPVPQSPGMFQSLLSLPTTLNNRFKDQLQSKAQQQPDTAIIHPYLIARDQHDAFSAQLKQLQEETRMALVRENILQKDRNKLFVNFIKDGGDLFGSLDGLYEWGHSDLTLGLISLVSAGISIFRMWSKYKQTIEKAILEEAREVIRKQQEEDEEQRRIEDDRAKLGEWADQVREYYENLQQQQFQEQQLQLQEHQQQLQDHQQQHQQLQDQLNVYQTTGSTPRHGYQQGDNDINDNNNDDNMTTPQKSSNKNNNNNQNVKETVVINDVQNLQNLQNLQDVAVNNNNLHNLQDVIVNDEQNQNLIVNDELTSPLPDSLFPTPAVAPVAPVPINTMPNTGSTQVDGVVATGEGLNVEKKESKIFNATTKSSKKKKKDNKNGLGNDELSFNITDSDLSSAITASGPQEQQEQALGVEQPMSGITDQSTSSSSSQSITTTTSPSQIIIIAASPEAQVGITPVSLEIDQAELETDQVEEQAEIGQQEEEEDDVAQ